MNGERRYPKHPLWAVVGIASMVIGIMYVSLSPAGASKAQASTKHQLSQKLLTISEMPTGWSTQSASSGSAPPSCLANYEKERTRYLTVEASFVDGANFPQFSESLSTGGQKHLELFTKALSSCKNLTVSSGGQSFSGSLQDLSLPRFGNKSRAFVMTFAVQGLTVQIQVDAFVQGKIVGLTQYAQLGSADTNAMIQLTAAAVAKVNGSVVSGHHTASVIAPFVSTDFGGTGHPTFESGKKGAVDLLYVGSAYSLGSGDGTVVPVEVWNGTAQTLSAIDISGPAMSGSAVVGSGDSQDVEPGLLAPGEVAIGMVFYSQELPAGATFNLTATGTPENTSDEVNLKVVQANYSPSGGIDGPGVVGTVTNTGNVAIMNPIPTDLYCFGPTGSLSSVWEGFVAGDAPLPPGATGSFSISVLDQMPCTTFLVGASGYDAED